jgi:hypothetical protein
MPALNGPSSFMLRKIAARTVSTLWNALGDVLDRFTSQECANYLANAGYVPLNRIVQSGLAPENLTTSRHLSISAAM